MLTVRDFLGPQDLVSLEVRPEVSVAGRVVAVGVVAFLGPQELAVLEVRLEVTVAGSKAAVCSPPLETMRRC